MTPEQVQQSLRSRPSPGEMENFADAAANGNNVAVMGFLDKYSAFIDEKVIGGYTALIKAAEAGKNDTVELLLQRGANPEIGERYHLTGMMVAAMRGCTDTIAILLENGASVDTKSKAGRTALMYAAGRGQVKAAAFLLEAGAGINEVAENKKTPLIIAAQAGEAEMVNFLLEQGAIPVIQDKDGWTAETWAEKSVHPEIAEVLKRHAALYLAEEKRLQAEKHAAWLKETDCAQGLPQPMPVRRPLTFPGKMKL